MPRRPHTLRDTTTLPLPLAASAGVDGSTVDHFIVTGDAIVSFAERGLL